MTSKGSLRDCKRGRGITKWIGNELYIKNQMQRRPFAKNFQPEGPIDRVTQVKHLRNDLQKH